MAYSNIGAGARTGQRVTQPGSMSKQPLRKPGGGVLPSNMEQMPTFGPGASRGQMMSQPRNMEQMPTFNQGASRGQMVSQQPWQGGTNLGGTQPGDQMMQMYGQMRRQPMQQPWQGQSNPNQMAAMQRLIQMFQQRQQPTWGTNLGGGTGGAMMRMF